jgi:transcription antitermination factor NusG
LDEDLKRFQESSSKTIKLERQQIIEFITQQVAVLAVRNAEYRLSTVLKNGPGPISLKQKELNKIHIQETFNRLKRKLSSKYFLSNIYNL